MDYRPHLAAEQRDRCLRKSTYHIAASWHYLLKLGNKVIVHVGVLIGQINLPLFLLIADGAQAAHGRLKDKDAGLRLAEHGHAAQRTAVPALFAFFDKDYKLFFVAGTLWFI